MMLLKNRFIVNVTRCQMLTKWDLGPFWGNTLSVSVNRSEEILKYIMNKRQSFRKAQMCNVHSFFIYLCSFRILKHHQSQSKHCSHIWSKYSRNTQKYLGWIQIETCVDLYCLYSTYTRHQEQQKLAHRAMVHITDSRKWWQKRKQESKVI